MKNKSLLLVIVLGVAGGIVLSGIVVVGAYWAYLAYQKWEIQRLAELQAKEIQAELVRGEELTKRASVDCPKLLKMSPGELVKQVDLPPAIKPNNKSATVVFFRPDSEHRSDAIFYLVSENGRKIGGLKPGSYFTIKAKSGKHIYTTYPVSPVDGDNITIRVKANEIIYIMGATTPVYGGWCGLPRLAVSNSVEFDESKSSLTCLELTNAGKSYR